MSKHVVIVGGGVLGVCSAYYLTKRGHQVTIFEKDEIGKACSYGNAGLIVPSHFETLSNPAIRKKGLKWMLNPNSPFFLKPSLDLDLYKWIWKFNSFCTQKHVNENKVFLRDINLYSLELYKELYKSSDFDFSFKQSGLLVLCKEQSTLEEETHNVANAKSLGLNAKILNQEEIKKLEPNVSFNALGASYFQEDSIIEPYAFVSAIKNYLVNNGVVIYENTKIDDFEIKNNKIVSVKFKDEKSLKADSFILSSGIDSFELGKKLNLNLLMQGGKGFSFKVEKNSALDFKTPMLLAEQKVAVSPYKSYVRFGGTMMICGNDISINQRRVDNIKKAANSYINNLNIKNSEIQDTWAGLRPCSPDGLPFIGKAKLDNLFISTAHAMMGVSLAPATGKILTDLVSEKALDIDIKKMNLNRFKK